jgi:hypothetical protein
MPMLSKETSEVTAVAAAAPSEALGHFERLLSLETDCWDVRAALGTKTPGFVLLDVRGPDSFGLGTSPEQLIFPTPASMSGTLRDIHQTHCSSSTVTVRIAMVPTRLPRR